MINMPDRDHQSADAFDDYHQLLDLDMQSTRLVVCQGLSGNGKTTAIQYLYNEHEQLRHRTPHLFQVTSSRCLLPPLRDQLVVLDEIRFRRQLWPLARLLCSGNTVLVASHLAVACHWPLRLFGTVRIFSMDQNEEQLERYLEKNRLSSVETQFTNITTYLGQTTWTWDAF